MSKFAVPDTLVLKLEEVEKSTNLVDTTIYIFYDKRTQHFFLRGRRRWSLNHQSCTYSFQCEFAKDLADFLRYIICKNNSVTEVLYNYDNLDTESNDITFEFLHDYDHSDYEIAAYDKTKFSKRRVAETLRMLRNVFNYYK
jgi:hypothetical protein